ncbi:hypothetical protein M8C21_006592 [Ambrosia artemisiifolia]|uniref:Uncharacterized protein n=1 Tax=Ambrosia artemisiifolia TaxID=4212 RepID=A0AAD5CUL5_AMBAR|nr:hypothetical protein M8C21_006592 [Ambrosia artemisiifolia]
MCYSKRQREDDDDDQHVLKEWVRGRSSCTSPTLTRL